MERMIGFVFCATLLLKLIHFQGKKNNYNLSVFRDVILAFFYSTTDTKCVAQIFREHFAEQVPDNVLVLAVTVVC